MLFSNVQNIFNPKVKIYFIVNNNINFYFYNKIVFETSDYAEMIILSARIFL